MGVNLGSAVAYIDLDASKFETGLKKTVAGLKTAMDSSNSTGERFTALGTTMSSVGKKMTLGLSVPLVGIGAASVKTAADFEAGMSKVQAISGATGNDMQKLEKMAKDLGSTTKFSATEAADALSFMGMAGWDTQSMLDGLPGVLDLAAAGGTDLATTSDIVTDGLTSLGLTAKDTGMFVDVMAATCNSSNTSIELMGETLKYVGPVAGALGIDMQSLSSAIGLMGNAGIKGSQAGTALRSGLNRLIKPTAKSAAAMKKYGIEIQKNSDGSVDLMSTMHLLRGKLGDLDETTQAAALSTIFGTEAMSGWAAIVNASESDFEKLNESIYNADGAAKQVAETMQDNLSGQLTNLKSALEGAAISIGEALLPVMKQLVEWINQAVTWFNNLSPSMQTTIITVAGVVAAIGPLLMIGGSLITAITTIGSAFTGLGTVLGGASTMFGLFGSSAVGVAGPMAGAAAGGTALAGILGPVLIAALVGVIAKIGDSTTALSWMQDKFGSVGTVIGAVCEFISGVWDFTIGNLITIGKAGFDVLAAIIDGPGGASVKDAMSNFGDAIVEKNSKAWDKVTLKTTRELSQQKNSVDKETKEAADKADKNTKKMADDMGKNAQKASADLGKGMNQASKVAMDESGKIPKDVKSNMDQSVQAMRQAGSDIYNGMNTSFSKLASQGKQHFSNLHNGVTNSTSQMATKTISDWNRIKSALSSKIVGTVEIKTVGVQQALNQINSVKNASKRSLISDSQSSYNGDAIKLLNEGSRMLRSSSVASYAAINTSGISQDVVIKADVNKGNKEKDKTITVNLNIDKFVNESKQDIDDLMNEIAFQLKRKSFI